MTHRHQRGWLKKEKRSLGETWVLLFGLRLVNSDGKQWENKIPIGLVKDFSSKSCAWGRSKDNISTWTGWISADVQHLLIWRITTRTMSSSNPPNPSIPERAHAAIPSF